MMKARLVKQSGRKMAAWDADAEWVAEGYPCPSDECDRYQRLGYTMAGVHKILVVLQKIYTMRTKSEQEISRRREHHINISNERSSPYRYQSAISLLKNS